MAQERLENKIIHGKKTKLAYEIGEKNNL